MSSLKDRIEAPVVKNFAAPPAAPAKPWTWRRILWFRAYQRRAALCEALRSGKYYQTRGTLVHPNGNSCALNLGGQLGLYGASVEPSMRWQKARGALALSRYDHDKIWRMNDLGDSSSEIADYIESLP